MHKRIRPLPRDIIVRGIIHQMNRFGVVVCEREFCFPHGSPSTVAVGPNLGHLCFGDDEEWFQEGVPVISPIIIPWKGSNPFKVTLQEPSLPYWTGPVRLLHEWAEPDERMWRMLNLLEGASLLAMDPGLGSVRCRSIHATNRCVELFMENGRMFVWQGMTPPGHHAAYTMQPRDVRVDEGL